MSLEYASCPFKVTEDGIDSHMGCMCGIHLKEDGKARYSCCELHCRVWEIISDLDRSGDTDSHEIDRLEDEVTVLKEKIHALEHPELTSSS